MMLNTKPVFFNTLTYLATDHKLDSSAPISNTEP